MASNGRTYADALPVGTQVGEYELGDPIGQGGEGIVYEAKHSEFGDILVKEYWPSHTVSRSADGSATAKQSRYSDDLRAGISRFLKMGERLKGLPPHENVMHVLDAFEGKRTAYWAMERVQGKSLQEVFSEDGFSDPENVKDLAHQLTDGLRYLHHEGVWHRDIAPDNIIITQGHNWKAVLIDLNAAKDLVLRMTKSAAAVTKPGYSPIEQYDTSSGDAPGPWSDIYGTGAVLYHAITGDPPRDAPSRSFRSDHKLLADRAPEGYDDSFVAAIDHALEQRPDKRPQTIDQWRLELGLDGGLEDPLPPPPWWQTKKAATAAGVAAALLVPAVTIATFGLPSISTSLDEAEQNAGVVAQAEEAYPDCAALEEGSTIQICDNAEIIDTHQSLKDRSGHPVADQYIVDAQNCTDKQCIELLQRRATQTINDADNTLSSIEGMSNAEPPSRPSIPPIDDAMQPSPDNPPQTGRDSIDNYWSCPRLIYTDIDVLMSRTRNNPSYDEEWSYTERGDYVYVYRCITNHGTAYSGTVFFENIEGQFRVTKDSSARNDDEFYEFEAMAMDAYRRNMTRPESANIGVVRIVAECVRTTRRFTREVGRATGRRRESDISCRFKRVTYHSGS